MARDPEPHAVPVLDDRGFVFLWDLYVAGQWVGSKRTEQQVADRLSFLTGTSIEPINGSPW